MYDCKGREIKDGDWVKSKATPPAIGVANALNPKCETCNLRIAVPTPFAGAENRYATAKETEIVMRADGSDPDAA